MFTNVSMMNADATPNPFAVDLYEYLVNTLGFQITHGQASQSVKVYPYVTYFQVISLPEYQASGSSGLTRETYQFDCYSPNYLDVVTAAEQLMSALDSYRGLMGTTTVQTVTKTNGFTKWEKPIDASDTGKHRAMLEFRITYESPVYNAS